MAPLQEGLHIVVVGISGVFVNLLVLMGVVTLIGRVFGKKPKAKTKKPKADGAEPPADPAPATP